MPEKLLLLDNKHRKLFVIKLSKRCTFMPKMHRNTLGGQAPPGPAWGAYELPRSLAAMGVGYF